MDFNFDNLNVEIDYFVERKCTPNWIIPKSNIIFHDLTYVLSGSATYIVNNTPFQINAGDIIYIPKGCQREAFTSPDHPMHCFAFNFQCFNRHEDITNLAFPTQFKLQGSGEILNYYKSFSKIWLEKKKGYNLEARAILMLVLHKATLLYSSKNISEIDNERINIVKSYVLDNFNKKISIDYLANLLNLHPVYFGAFFKKKTATTIKDYINYIRIQKAHNLLSTGGYTVTEVAIHCGYEDVFYFSKVFKKIKGYSPSNTAKI
jgi:AraC family transcriptional regulator, arabinose operon regulatory protein